jgi:thiamine biosynthesis lipoprotein
MLTSRAARNALHAIVVATIGALLLACGDAPERVTLRGATMGTTWSVIYGAPAPESARALQDEIEKELRAINAALSTYIPDSEISRLNDRPGTVSVELSPRFAAVLDAALAVSAMTGGAYDVTVGPLVELWGFGVSSFAGQLPAEDAIDEARGRVGTARLDWDAANRRLQRPAGMRIDLSSIAKGYAVDRISDLLAERGLENTLVEIGGELRARGERPEGGPWRLAVESPDPAERRFVDALSVSDVAVATSGDYRNFFEVDGRRYSHLVDPRTGYPVAHDLVSVTVVDAQCMLADALATALIVLGLEEARVLAEREGSRRILYRGQTRALRYTTRRHSSPTVSPAPPMARRSRCRNCNRNRYTHGVLARFPGNGPDHGRHGDRRHGRAGPAQRLLRRAVGGGHRGALRDLRR